MTAQRRQAVQKNNKQRAKTNILRAFLFPGPTNPFHRRRILFPKVNYSFHKSRSPCIRAQKPRFCARNARKQGFQSQKAHKKPDFVLENPKNGGSEGQKRTKTPILYSKTPKTGVPDPKSAQKPRFCARNARKQGSRRPKAHENLDFVLGKKGIGSGKRRN